MDVNWTRLRDNGMNKSLPNKSKTGGKANTLTIANSQLYHCLIGFIPQFTA